MRIVPAIPGMLVIMLAAGTVLAGCTTERAADVRPGYSGAVSPAMRAHQRVRVEVLVENLDIATRDRAGLVAHDRTVSGVEVADRQCREFAAHQSGKAPHARKSESLAARACLAHRPESVEGGTQV